MDLVKFETGQFLRTVLTCRHSLSLPTSIGDLFTDFQILHDYFLTLLAATAPGCGLLTNKIFMMH